MSLFDLPNELLLPIAEYLTHAHDVNSFLQTSRRLAILLTPILNEHALQSKHSMTALFWAAANGNAPLAHLLLTRGSRIVVPAPSTKGNLRELHKSPNPCPDTVLRYVIDQGVNLTLQDRNGTNWTAFHWAASRGGESAKAMIRFLISRGADADTRDHQGRTSLHLGAWFGTGVVEVLLASGADISAKDLEGNTPLHMAVRYSKEVAEVLLRCGANPNAKDGEGRTPLHLAADGSRGCVGILLAHGADMALRDKAGRTPLHLATRFKGGAEAVKLLVERGASIMA